MHNRFPLLRLLTHCAMGVALGAGLALFLLATDTGRIYSMIAHNDRSLSGAFSLILGFALIIGIGASITGLSVKRTAEFARYTDYIWRAIEEEVRSSIDAELEQA